MLVDFLIVKSQGSKNIIYVTSQAIKNFAFDITKIKNNKGNKI